MQLNLQTEFFNEIIFLNDPLIIENLKSKYQTYFFEISEENYSNEFLMGSEKEIQNKKKSTYYLKLCIFKKFHNKKFFIELKNNSSTKNDRNIIIYSNKENDDDIIIENKSFCYLIEKIIHVYLKKFNI